MLCCILLLLLGPFVAVQSASVEPSTLYAAGRCENFSLAPLACQSTLAGSWSRVWTAPSLGLSQEFWEAQMYGAVLSTDTEFVSYLDVISSLPYKGCAEAYAKLICPTFFSPCIANLDPTTNTEISVVPVPVCRSVCIALNDACREFKGGADLLDCFNTTSALTGQPQWPEDSESCTTAPVLVDDDEPSALEYTCPPPLVFEPNIPDQYTGLGCSSTCHEKLFMLSSHDDFFRLYLIVSILAWISFALVCVMMITIVMFEPLREFPTRIVFYICIGLFFGYLGPIGATFIGIDYTCQSHTELAYGISYCSFYAWCMYFGAMVAVIWWCYQAFVIFYNLVLSGTESKGDKKYEWVVLICGWTYSIVATIVLATVPTSAPGSRGNVPWCFTGVSQPGYHQNMIWGMFVTVLIVGGVLTAIFIGSSLIKLAIVGFRSSMKKVTLFKFFMVMLIFCTYFLIADMAILAVIFDIQVEEPKLTASVAEWHTCVFSWRIATNGCPKGKLHYGLSVWQGVCFPLAGITLFICFFVLRERTWRCWQKFISNLVNGREAFEGITSMTTARGSTMNTR